MADARGPERGGDPEPGRHRVEPLPPVELDVLAGVEEVEPRDPHGDGEPEEPRRRLHRPAHRDPGAGRRRAVGEPEDPVGEPREALRVGVAHQEDERDRRQREAERPELPRGHEEDRRRARRGDGEVAGREEPAREVPPGRPRVPRVEMAVDQPVRRHRRRPRRDHRHRDPEDGVPPGPPARRQHHAEVGERQREHGVLHLDRVEEVPERRMTGFRVLRLRRSPAAGARSTPSTGGRTFPGTSPRPTARRAEPEVSASGSLSGPTRG